MIPRWNRTVVGLVLLAGSSCFSYSNIFSSLLIAYQFPAELWYPPALAARPPVDPITCRNHLSG